MDTIICFNLGLYYSFYKHNLDKFIMYNDIIYYGILIIFILAYYYYYIASKENIYNIFLKNAFFTFVAIFLTMKIRFKNEYLFLLNNYSYSIYLLQRVVFIHTIKKKYFYNNELIRFFFDYLFTIFLAALFDKYTNSINYLLKYKNKREKQKIILNNNNILVDDKKNLIQLNK